MKSNFSFKKLNITTPQQLMQFMKENLRYGFTYRNKIFTCKNNNSGFDKEMNKYYKIRLGEDFIKSGYGVCWDFCELERMFFTQMNIPHECYFIESYVNRAEGGPTHTFLLYEDKGSWVWFEYSWGYEQGIHKFSSRKEALDTIIKKHLAMYNSQFKRYGLYKTQPVTKRLNTFEFVEHCFKGEKIN